MNNNLKRIDTALRLLADVTQELHSLRTLMTQLEPSDEPHEEVYVKDDLGYHERQILDALAHGNIGFINVGEAAEAVKWLYPEPSEGLRDQRKNNAQRTIKSLIAKGYLYEHQDGTLDFGVT